jgi:hypothetical protein
MAVCVKTLSTVMRRGEAALVFVAGFADIEDLHALFSELPAHCAVEAFPFHSLISPEEQASAVRPGSRVVNASIIYMYIAHHPPSTTKPLDSNRTRSSTRRRTSER